MVPSLTIAIATMGDRLTCLDLPGPLSGVRYYVGIQRSRGVPKSLSKRNDIVIEELGTLGLSRSRNAALSACDTDLLLLADDDLVFNMEGIEKLRSEFAADLDLDIATGRLESTEGGLLKEYPRGGKVLERRSCGYIGSPEVMMRMSFVSSHSLRFDERFGVGSEYPSGEEYIFVTDALKLGASVRHFDAIVAAHEPISTGSNWHDPKIVDARAKVLRRVWGVAGYAARIKYAISKRQLLGPGNTLRFAFGLPCKRLKIRSGRSSYGRTS